MYGPRDIEELRLHSKSSVNLSPTFISSDGHDNNVLQVPVPVQRGLCSARSAENLTFHQHKHKRPLPSVPTHAPSKPPKPAPRCPSPRPSISSIDEDWGGSSRLLVHRPSPRPSVTSLDVVTLGSTDCLEDDIDVYIKSQRRLTAGVFLLGGVMLVFMGLVSLGLVWIVKYEIPRLVTNEKPRGRMVAAHVVINSTALKLEQDLDQPKIGAQKSGPWNSCQKGTELRPWITDRDITTLTGIDFNDTTNRLVIATSGHYFVYSQVVFHKVANRTQGNPLSNSLFHVMCKTSPHHPEPKDLLQATETPNKVIDWEEDRRTAFHTSHISGVVPLLKGDEIYVKVSDLELVQPVGNARTIFTGLFRLPTAGADPGS